MKQSYNEHIRALADKFRAEVTPDRQSVSAGEIMRARIAVAEMAETARSVFSYIDDPGIDPISDVNNYLKEQGLIPDDGQEDREDGR